MLHGSLRTPHLDKVADSKGIIDQKEYPGNDILYQGLGAKSNRQRTMGSSLRLTIKYNVLNLHKLF